MTESTKRQPNGIQQYVFYSALCLAALAFAIVILPLSAAYFRRFFGSANPLLVILAASVIGTAALFFLQSRFSFVILKGPETLRGIGLSALLATGFAVAIVIADFVIRYPEDTNVPVPQAFLFYPAIGFVAEIAFHVLPLAILLAALSPLARRLGRERVIWLGILAVAILEPTFQVLFEGSALTWRDAYTWVHVFAFAALQLYVFKRFDFTSMYSFRLVYYAYWHILWGVLRLHVLF